MTESKDCPRCGKPLPQIDVLVGRCPFCLLQRGFESDSGNGKDFETAVGSPDPAAIGRYRVLRRIGQGGMGVVYEAEQDQPRRTVALKIIKPGMASPELLRRFEQESQALGRLQHPGIAQIYEAGTVDTGFGPQPYFAMELIRGRAPRDFANAHQMGTRQRLEIMAKICDAVHHAHQRGLIHRDLKPGNILIDESGQPKILDFGVARVTDSDVWATIQTDMGQLIGTLAYMSPEQVLADPMDIDTRSDVYSLGVILYEFLSGRLPYPISKKIHETIQSIREEDPASLSTANRTLRGDIETIVAKALEKDRSRRYASAAEMAADIHRYLKDEPISARPASAIYQLQKFARRNKALVSGIVAVFVVLVAGVGAFAWEAADATRERDRAIQANRKAEDEHDRASINKGIAKAQSERATKSEEQARMERDRADKEAAIARAVQSFMVPIEASVKDSNGRPVMDLKPDDFQIYEDGEVQKTLYFALADAPRSTMLIFDRSWSSKKQELFMLEAIKVFIQTTRPSDRLAIFSFGIDLEVRIRWQTNDNGKEPKVSMPLPQPWSGVYSAIDKAGKRFDNEKGRKAIIMLTDGNDSEFYNDVRRLGGVLDIAKDNTFQGYLKKFRKQNIPVYFIALEGDPGAEYAALKSSEYRGSPEYNRGIRSPTVAEDFLKGARLRLEKIAEATGGRVFVPTRITDVAAEYGTIARDPGTSYSLGYAPSNAVSDVKAHRIEVRVRRPGLEVTQSRYSYQR